MSPGAGAAPGLFRPDDRAFSFREVTAVRISPRHRLAATLSAAVLSAAAGCALPTDQPAGGQAFPPGKQPVGYSPPAPPSPPSFHRPEAVALDPVLAARAADEVRAAMADPTDEVRRGHGLEAVQDGRLPDAARYVLPGLDDPSPLVRKVAAMVAGQLRIRAAMPKLLALAAPQAGGVGAGGVGAGGVGAATTAEVQERLAVLYALHRLGDVRYSHEFEVLAGDPRAGVRRDVGFMLGRLANLSAKPILEEMFRHDKEPNVRMEAAEALWRIGDEHGEDALIAALISRYGSDRIIALLALAGPRDQRVLGHVESELTDDYPEVRLAAARAAGELGSMNGYGVAVAGAKAGDPRQRALAAFAFAGIGRDDCQPYLATLLDDPVPEVRLAAAAAVLELNAPPERR